MRSPQETIWVQAAARGDAEAFARLVDCYWDPVRRWLFGMTGKNHLAEDAAQVAIAVGAIVLAVKDTRAARVPAPAAIVVEEAVVEPTPGSIVQIPPVKLAPTPVPKSAPEASKPTVPPAIRLAQKDRFLEVLGSLSAAHLFQSYLNIGLLADGVESEAYTTDEAFDALRSINDVMDQIEEQLETLTKVGLEPEDNAAIAQIKAVTVLLRLQSKCLLDYWTKGDAKKAEEYHVVRKAAWKGLSNIMQAEAK